MPSTKITNMDEALSIDGANDYLVMVDVDDTTQSTSGTNKKIKPDNLGISGGATLEQEVTQVAHGFLVGDAIKHNGTIWTKAQADSVSNAGTLGVVSVVTDLDNFTYTFGGILTVGVWTSGTDYFLSPSTAGDIITEPTYNVGEVREFLGTGTPDGLLLEIDLGDETAVSTAIPLTTKGDLLAYDTDLARLPVGTNDQVLTADSTQALGVAWKDAAGGGGNVYDYVFFVDAADTTNWMKINGIGATWHEYNTSISIAKTSSLTTASTGAFRISVPLFVAEGSQTITSFFLAASGQSGVINTIDAISIVKVRHGSSGVNSVTVLYESNSITFSQKGSDYEYFELAAVDFAVTSLSDGDFVYIFYGGSGTFNAGPSYHKITTT